MRGVVIVGAICGVLLAAPASRAQTAAGSAPQSAPTTPGLDDRIDAAEAEGDFPVKKVNGWNEFEWEYVTLRIGGGFLYDAAAYAQDADSKQQMTLSPATGLRDFRLLFKGRFKFAPRVSYTLGYMYDGASKEWRFRQTGLMVDVPELLGDIFIGRTKEGFSTNKLMVGYQGWTNERATINDALLPILADGVRWTGRTPSGKLVYNFGFFFDEYSEAESYNKNDNVFAARAVWLPFMGTDKGVLHLAVEGRYGEADDGQLRYRSRPESFLAQTYAIDTGVFPASHMNTLGVESYYRPGPLMFGMEYFFNQVSSSQTHNPLFHGGEIFGAYLFTGELHPYDTRGAFFEAVSPARSVFDGGPGAWELVVRLSYSDLNGGTISGGRFSRITPMVNWYLSKNVRLEFVYGYGALDRYGITGYTQFFQARLQLQL